MEIVLADKKVERRAAKPVIEKLENQIQQLALELERHRNEGAFVTPKNNDLHTTPPSFSLATNSASCSYSVRKANKIHNRKDEQHNGGDHSMNIDVSDNDSKNSSPTHVLNSWLKELDQLQQNLDYRHTNDERQRTAPNNTTTSINIKRGENHGVLHHSNKHYNDSRYEADQPLNSHHPKQLSRIIDQLEHLKDEGERTNPRGATYVSCEDVRERKHQRMLLSQHGGEHLVTGHIGHTSDHAVTKNQHQLIVDDDSALGEENTSSNSSNNSDNLGQMHLTSNGSSNKVMNSEKFTKGHDNEIESFEQRIKAEKIRQALAKMREAAITKIYIKVYGEDGSVKSLLVDERMTVGQVCQMLLSLQSAPLTSSSSFHHPLELGHEQVMNDVRRNCGWALVELLPDLHMERAFEDHEYLVTTLLHWKGESKNTLWFIPRPEVYDLFHRPEIYLLGFNSSQAGHSMSVEGRRQLLSEYFGVSVHSTVATRPPNVEGPLWLKSPNKKSWKQVYCVLRPSGIYLLSPPSSSSTAFSALKHGSSTSSVTSAMCRKGVKDLTCLVRLDDDSNQVYFGVKWQPKFKSPTRHCFAVKDRLVQTTRNTGKYICYLCAHTEEQLNRWVTGIRLVKYGHKLYENYVDVVSGKYCFATLTEDNHKTGRSHGPTKITVDRNSSSLSETIAHNNRDRRFHYTEFPPCLRDEPSRLESPREVSSGGVSRNILPLNGGCSSGLKERSLSFSHDLEGGSSSMSSASRLHQGLDSYVSQPRHRGEGMVGYSVANLEADRSLQSERLSSLVVPPPFKTPDLITSSNCWTTTKPSKPSPVVSRTTSTPGGHVVRFDPTFTTIHDIDSSPKKASSPLTAAAGLRRFRRFSNESIVSETTHPAMLHTATLLHQTATSPEDDGQVKHPSPLLRPKGKMNLSNVPASSRLRHNVVSEGEDDETTGDESSVVVNTSFAPSSPTPPPLPSLQCDNQQLSEAIRQMRLRHNLLSSSNNNTPTSSKASTPVADSIAKSKLIIDGDRKDNLSPLMTRNSGPGHQQASINDKLAPLADTESCSDSSSSATLSSSASSSSCSRGGRGGADDFGLMSSNSRLCASKPPIMPRPSQPIANSFV